MKKRIFCFLLTIVMAFCVLPPTTYVANAADYATELRNKGFPENYISKLVELHKKYPKWNFEPLNTGLDFNTAVNKERSPHSQQLIQKTSSNDGKGYYCDCSSCYKNGNYVPQEGRSWISASRNAVEYYMNPVNFLDEKYIFQFESTNYSNQQTIEGIETIISNTWMKNAYITYKDASGNTVNYSPSTKYSTAIMDAAKNSGMSAYYLASKIVQEVGGAKPTAGGASGTYPGYKGIYNYYNIGANTGVEDGLVWASTSSSGYVTNCTCRMRAQATTNSSIVTELPPGTPVTYISSTSKQSDGHVWYYVSANRKGSTYTGYIRSDLVDYKQNDKYNRPWTNPYLSIYNGAKFIATGFSKTQYTGYLQKFNVNPASGSNMHGHEYMANVQAAASEALSSYRAYSSAGLLAEAKTFVIPVFSGTSGWRVIDGKTYYYYDNGDFAKGWRMINGTWYYFSQSGVMQTGWLLLGDKWYYLNSSGAMITGWQNIKNIWYWFDSNGVMVKGWQTIGGHKYYFNEQGGMLLGWHVMNNKWYYFDKSGAMVTGWLQEGANKFWLDNNGVMAIGFKEIDGRKYYFNLSGIMQTSWQIIDNKKYYFNESGAMITGWRFINNIWYWFNDEGIMMTGWKTINGQKYYFNEKGEMLLGWQVMNNKWYYFNGTGAMVTGWFEQGGKKYWLDNDGVMAIGFKTIGNTRYFFNSSGAMIKGWQYINDNWYWFTDSGSMITGWRNINNTWYWFKDDGVMITGWRLINNNWYWFASSGAMVTGWQTIGGSTYYFYSSGEMAVGKQKINGVIYDFGQDGKCRNPKK